MTDTVLRRHHLIARECFTLYMEKAFASAALFCGDMDLGAVPEIILGGGGPQALFCPLGGGCFVDNVSKGWGDNLSWGSRCI